MSSVGALCKPGTASARGPARVLKPLVGASTRCKTTSAFPVAYFKHHRARSGGYPPCSRVQSVYAEQDATVAQQLGQLVSLIKQTNPARTDDAVKEAEKLASSIATQLASYRSSDALLNGEGDEVVVLADRLREQEALLSSLQGALRDSESKRGTEYQALMDVIKELEEALAMAQEQIEAQPGYDELEQEMTTAQQQLQQQQQEIKTLRSKLESSEKLIKQYQDATELARAKAEEAEARLQAALKESAASAAELDKWKRQARFPGRGKSSRGFGIRPFESGGASSAELERVEAELEEAQRGLEEKEAAVRAAQQEVSELRSKLGAKESEIRAGSERLNQLQASLQQQLQAAEAMEESLGQKGEELQRLMAAYQKELSTLLTDKKQLEAKVQELSEQLQQALKSGGAQQQQPAAAPPPQPVVEKTADGKTYRALADELSAEVAAQQKELKVLKEELKQAVNRELQKSSQLSRAMQDVLLLEKAQTALSEEKEQLTQRVAKLQASSKAAETQAAQLKAQLSDTAVVLKSRDEELARTGAELRKLQTEVTAAKVEVEAAKENERLVLAKMAAVQGDLEGEKQVSARRYSQLSKAEQEVSRLQARVSSLEEELRAVPLLQKQLEERESLLEELRNALEAAVSDNSSLMEQLQAASDTSRQLQGLANKVGAGPAKDALQSMARQLGDMQAQLAGSLAAQTALQEELLLAQQQRDQARAELEQLQQQVSVLDSELAAATQASEESALLVAELSEQARVEAAAAAELLARAEALARGLSGAEAADVQQQQQQQLGSGGDAALLRQQLQQQRAESLQADRLLNRLQNQVKELQAELAAARAGSGANGAGSGAALLQRQQREDLDAAVSERLRAEAQAAALQRQVSELESRLRNQAAAAAEPGSELAAALLRVSELEQENVRLRSSAAKREAVLAQSRQFVEAHLQRWGPVVEKAMGEKSKVRAKVE